MKINIMLDAIDNSNWTVVVIIIVLLLAWLADRWVNKREDNKNKL